MYSYRHAKQIEVKLNEPFIKEQIGFDDTAITLILGNGEERELEEFEKKVAEEKDWIFNVTMIFYKENGGIESTNFDDSLFERLGIKI